MAGALGMTRTTCALSGSIDSSREVVMPAAIETTSVPADSASASSRTAMSMTCGFTASTTISASPATSPVM